ncbi:hypothetical protein CISG_02569 [Coccidioides immitis RMSCC 3703]|uniref:Uncharacterized protein n=1 Tax=Coccidioides immitis RMSCC 3703 TaxID=454286 RepID=A0A0J8U3A6_COCIT|nr:hypothetical protein CISG_02569 [Coccidioides immitis RMSCC 3703]
MNGKAVDIRLGFRAGVDFKPGVSKGAVQASNDLPIDKGRYRRYQTFHNDKDKHIDQSHPPPRYKARRTFPQSQQLQFNTHKGSLLSGLAGLTTSSTNTGELLLRKCTPCRGFAVEPQRGSAGSYPAESATSWLRALSTVVRSALFSFDDHLDTLVLGLFLVVSIENRALGRGCEQSVPSSVSLTSFGTPLENRTFLGLHSTRPRRLDPFLWITSSKSRLVGL